MRINASFVVDKRKESLIPPEELAAMVKDGLCRKLAWEILKMATVEKDKWFTIYGTKYSISIEVLTPLQYVQLRDSIEAEILSRTIQGMQR